MYQYKKLSGIGVAALTVATAISSGCAGNKEAVKADEQQEQSAGMSSQQQGGQQAKAAAPSSAGGSSSSHKQQQKLTLGETVVVPGSSTIETTRTVIQPKVEKRSIPTVEEKSVKADINRMKAEDFVALGLDRTLADQVIQFRQQLGKFKSVEDLMSVPGIDMAWVDRHEDRLSTGQQG